MTMKDYITSMYVDRGCGNLLAVADFNQLEGGGWCGYIY